MLRVVYDPTADALYVRLRRGSVQARVLRMSDDLALDFDERDRVVGIEILRASAYIDRPDAPTVELEGISPG